jgi:hypothetical protein
MNTNAQATPTNGEKAALLQRQRCQGGSPAPDQADGFFGSLTGADSSALGLSNVSGLETAHIAIVKL